MRLPWRVLAVSVSSRRLASVVHCFQIINCELHERGEVVAILIVF
jgi:hypothetical protein